MPFSKDKKYSMRLTEKNKVYANALGIIDKNGNVKRTGPDFTKVFNDCFTFVMESAMSSYSTIASPKELELAWHDHLLRTMKRQNDELLKEMQTIIQERREVEDELLHSQREKALKETKQ